jgi:chitinase
MEVSYSGDIYSCLQPNTSQAGWNPVAAPSLWQLVGPCTQASPTPTPTATPSPIVSATPTLTESPVVSATASPTPSPTLDLSLTPTASPTPGAPRVLAYFPEWSIYGEGFTPKNIVSDGDAAKLTHILYAFDNVSNNACVVGVNQTGVGDAWGDYQVEFTAANSVNGVADTWNQPLKGCWNQMLEIKALYPKLKVLMSLGGWTWSDGFYTAAQPANRAAFVASCINAYISGNLPFDAGSNTGGTGVAAGIFDGFCIDWEYPGICGNDPGCAASPADKANLIGLLQEFRSQMDAVNPALELDVAVPAGVDKMAYFDIASMVPSVSFVDLMAYDFFGAWNATGPTGLQAALYAWPGMPTSGVQGDYYGDYAVQAWKQGGMPAAMMDLGMPAYGRGWTGVGDANQGLNQAASGPAACSGFSGCTAGITNYNILAAMGAPKFYGAGTAWTYDGTNFWSFDDPTSVATKAAYIKAQGLGGAMFWALDGDDGTLVAAAAAGIK